MKRLFYQNMVIFFLNLFFIYLLLEREGKGGRKRVRETSITPSPGDLAHNPGMCPDQESNQGPFSLQACAQSTEPHQPGLKYVFKEKINHRLKEVGAKYIGCPVTFLRVRVFELQRRWI